ncbi:MAG: PKD domain-containing protein [Thermoplasmata archaeon]|nr:PKD domain-containing protein [Thermoplasmata archaeon]
MSRTFPLAHLPLYPGMLAYDSALGGTVEFDGYFGNTWEFGPAGWTNLSPAHEPPTRLFGSLAYDVTANELVLFGGLASSGTHLLNDTWVFRGGDWYNVTGPTDPSPRYGTAAANDPFENGVLLFGGLTSNPSFPTTNETFLYNGTEWNRVLTASAPPATFLASMAYESVYQQIVLFGGENVTANSSSFLNETWIYSSGTWSNFTGGGPTPRAGSGMSDDVSLGGVLVFGGTGLSNGNVVFNDTWTYVLGVWTLVAASPSPAARYSPGLAVDSLGRDVLDGGLAPTGGLGGFQTDTWEFVSGVWTELQANFTPDARIGAAFAGAVGSPTSAVLFGGAGANSAPRNDTWEFSRDYWRERISPGGPPSRAFGMLAGNPAGVDEILFGGNTGLTLLNDTWSFNGTTWTNRTATIGPSVRAGGSFVFDPATHTDILFGGVNATNVTLNDTWSLQSGVWTQMTPSLSPPARWLASAAYDPALGGIVLFGGTPDGTLTGTLAFNDTWLYSGGNWSKFAGTTPPAARFGAGISADPRVGGLVLFGGWTPTGPRYQYNDTWALGPTGWRPIPTTAAPPRLGFSDIWWDSVSNLTWLYGGAALDVVNRTIQLGAETDALDLLTTNITAVGTGGPVPYTVSFSASARGGAAPYRYSWAIGGAISSAANGSFVVGSVGTYTLYLNVSDSWGVVQRSTFPVTTTPGPLTTSFTATPSTGTAPLTVAFVASASGGAAPYEYGWSFGDGASAPRNTATSASHQYASAGLFTVTLNVTDITGAYVVKTSMVDVMSTPQPAHFQASASVSPLSGSSPLNISYSATTHNGTGPFVFSWTFGDGNSSTTSSGVHQYSTDFSSSFAVKFVTLDANGTRAFHNFTVNVFAPLGGPPPRNNSGSSGPAGGVPWWAWVNVAVAVAAAVVAVAILRSRRPPPQPTESAAPAVSAVPTVPPPAPSPWDEGGPG